MSFSLKSMFKSTASASLLTIGLSQGNIAKANEYLDGAIATLKALHPTFAQIIDETDISASPETPHNVRAYVTLKDDNPIIVFNTDNTTLKESFDALYGENSFKPNNPDFETYAHIKTTLTLGHEIAHVLQFKHQNEWDISEQFFSATCTDVIAIENSAHDFTFELAAILYEQLDTAGKRAVNWSLSENTNRISLLEYTNNRLVGNHDKADNIKKEYLNIRADTYINLREGDCKKPPAAQATQAAKKLNDMLKF